jgi:hypothetical protein
VIVALLVARLLREPPNGDDDTEFTPAV